MSHEKHDLEKSYDHGLKDLCPEEWETTFPEICQQSCTDLPQKTALACKGIHLSFAELDRYANRFSNMLILNGFKKGDVVGINLPNIPEHVIAWIGTLRAGCVVSGMLIPVIKNPEVMKNEILNFAVERHATHEVPAFIEFRDELPLTPVGKTDKDILRNENSRGNERRRNMRKSVDLPCDVRLSINGKEARKPGNIVDISTEGIGVETKGSPEAETGEDAYIDIIQFGETFWLKGHVLGRKGNRIAVRFIETIPGELKEILSP